MPRDRSALPELRSSIGPAPHGWNYSGLRRRAGGIDIPVGELNSLEITAGRERVHGVALGEPTALAIEPGLGLLERITLGPDTHPHNDGELLRLGTGPHHDAFAMNDSSARTFSNRPTISSTRP